MYEALDEKIHVSEFYDVIGNRTTIWNIMDNFEKNNKEFYETIRAASDNELIFDKIELKKGLNKFIEESLLVKRHVLEVTELRDNSIIFH